MDVLILLRVGPLDFCRGGGGFYIYSMSEYKNVNLLPYAALLAHECTFCHILLCWPMSSVSTIYCSFGIWVHFLPYAPFVTIKVQFLPYAVLLAHECTFYYMVLCWPMSAISTLCCPCDHKSALSTICCSVGPWIHFLLYATLLAHECTFYYMLFCWHMSALSTICYSVDPWMHFLPYAALGTI